MRSIKFITAAIFASAFLTACGGGGGGGGSNGGSQSSISEVINVKGEFKYAAVTKAYPPKLNQATPGCKGVEINDRYFESDNALVYSVSNKPTDNDFKRAAAIVEEKFPSLLAKMGLTPAEFDALRPGISWGAYERIKGSDLFKELVLAGRTPQNPYGLEFDVEVKSLFSRLDRGQQDLITKAIEEERGLDLSGERYTGKMIVCLNEANASSAVSFAEGEVKGVEIPPKSMSNRSDYDTVFIHEMVHYIQSNVATPFYSATELDRWFIEGQASYIANQKIASKHENFNPVVFTAYNSRYPVEVDDQYIHFARAYKYLATYNDSKTILQVLLDNRYSLVLDPSVGDFGRSPVFEDAFNRNIRGADKNLMTVQYFEDNYFNLVK